MNKNLIVLGICSIFFSGCLATQQDVVSIQLEINDMNRKINENLKDSMTLNMKIREEIVEEIKKLKEINADLRKNIDIQNKYISQIGGKVDANNYRFEDFKVTQENFSKVDEKLAVIENKLLEILDSSVKFADFNIRDIYETARADFSRKNYDLAIIGFEKVAKQYPDNEYAKHAQFDIIITYYFMENWQKVIEESDFYFNKYPENNFYPKIYLIKAKSLRNLNNIDEAKNIYQLVITKYPQTEEAKSAKDDLEKISRSE